jgi:succinate dehydrogenase / fumarate reductase cytochrome b subunit
MSKEKAGSSIDPHSARPIPERPLSPHLQIWRWHITMLTSILHRVTGVGLYLAGLIVTAWAVSLAAGPEVYAGFKALLGSPLGKLVMLGMTASLFYHLANGIRHLVWDFGHALDLKSANSSAWMVFGFTVAATIAVWVIAYQTGALA